ncbi:MAG: VWA domain-containing protein [Pseudomonadota bacterium]
MAEIAVPEIGRLATNILHFARALRAAGVPVGPSRVVDAVRAVEAGGFEHRADLYHTLAACFLSRREQRAVFDQCFHLFWRDPQLLEKAMGLMLPEMRAPGHDREKRAGEDRAAAALTAGAEPPEPRQQPEDGEEIEIDAAFTVSSTEALRSRDFEQMTTAEITAAKRAIAQLSLPIRPIAARRTRPDPRGRLPDWRLTLRTALRAGGDIRRLETRARRQRWPALVVLCDISGSMAGYSRMLLHFLHAAANAKGAGWSRLHAFTFGTRLTNITRHLAHRDVDEALGAAGREVLDWEGGTRIGACLEAFNRDWSRRVLGQGAVVLLITDGLDRDDPGRLAKAAERLALSCRRLIWLNPLLRWDGFEARAGGVRALLPHVDSVRTAHSVASLDQLAAALSHADDRGDKARLIAGMRNLQASSNR